MNEKEEEIDFTKLPVEERIQHKNWKARVSGYEALLNVFNAEDDEKSPEFSKHLAVLKKAPFDSNVTAQEKGLAVVNALVENSHPSISGKIANDVINGCLVKGLLSARSKTKELVVEIVLMYIEIEKCEIVVDELLKALENKTPKVVAGTIAIFREAIRQFGPKWLKVGPVLKVIPSLFENKDKNIREETKQLTIELYRWLKDGLKPQLQGLKSVQLTELEGEFAKVKDEKPAASRYLRSQQVRNTEAAVSEVDGNAGSTQPAQVEEEIDAFEMLEPVEILTKLPSNFYEQCEEKKWQDRKAALETLQQILGSAPKLVAGDYSDLVKVLKKMVGKDTNVVVVGIAAKCLADLAAKLRKSFAPYSHSSVVVVLEKFKEKKQSVVLPLREAIDAIMMSTNIETILEDVVGALDNKNPQIKSETAQFVTRYTASSNPTFISNKKVLKSLISSLIKTLNDMDSGVRDASADAIGTIMKVVGEKTLAPLLQDVDAIKMAKVKECCEKAQVKYVAPVKLPAPAKPKSIRGGGGPPVSKALSSSQSSLKSNHSNEEEKPVTKKASTKPAAKAVAKPETKSAGLKKGVATTSAPAKLNTLKAKPKSAPPTRTDTKSSEPATNTPLMSVNNLKDQRISDEKALRVLKWNFTSPKEEFFVQLKEQMQAACWNDALIANCFRNDFKCHLKAIESLTDFLNQGNQDATICNSDLILKWCALRFFDTNPSVIIKAFEYLILLFEAFKSTSQQLPEPEAHSFIPYLIQKTGDPKNVFRQKVHDIIEELKHIYSPNRLFTFVMQGLTSKNARQRATCLDELGFLISSYGMSICQPSASVAVKEIGKQIGDKDSTVRNSALNCVVQVYYLEGEKVYKLIGNLSDKDMGMLEERIKRAAKNRPPPRLSPPVTPPKETQRVEPANIRSPSPDAKPVNTTRNRFQNGDTVTSPTSKHSPRTPSLEDLDFSQMRRLQQSGKGTFTRQRPKSTAIFTSDVHEIEQSFRREMCNESPTFAVSSTPVSNVQFPRDTTADELLRMPDVKLPRRKCVSASSLSMTDSERADRAVNTVMAQLTSHEIHVVIEALVQIREVILRPDRAEEFLSTKIDQLLIMCNIQYRLILQKHMDDESIPKAKVVDLYKMVTNVIDSIFKNPSLGKKASRDVLKDLITIVITILLDQRVTELSEGPNLIRTINMLATCIITSSDSTNMLSALIKLLHECIAGSGNQNQKFTEMVMKCIWKMTRLIDSFMNELNIDRILYDVHLFFESFPPEFWKTNHRQDTPLRTVKTVVFILVKNKKEAIFNNLTLISNMERSEIYSYIQRALKQVTKEMDENQEESRMSKASETPSSVSKAAKSEHHTLSKTEHQYLSTIIKKLGTPHTQEGLFELYEFCESHPTFHLESYLQRSTSEFFYSFVMNGLQQIKVDREKLQSKTTSPRFNNMNQLTNATLDMTLSATPRLPSRRAQNFIPNLTATAIDFESDQYRQRNEVRIPQLPTPDKMNMNHVKDWFVAGMTLAGVDKNTVDSKMEKIFNPENNYGYTGDPDKDLETATVMANNFLEEVKKFKEFLKK